MSKLALALLSKNASLGLLTRMEHIFRLGISLHQLSVELKVSLQLYTNIFALWGVLDLGKIVHLCQSNLDVLCTPKIFFL